MFRNCIFCETVPINSSSKQGYDYALVMDLWASKESQPFVSQLASVWTFRRWWSSNRWAVSAFGSLACMASEAREHCALCFPYNTQMVQPHHVMVCIDS
eukprot:2068421-Amphidinium_carterae.1